MCGCTTFYTCDRCDEAEQAHEARDAYLVSGGDCGSDAGCHQGMCGACGPDSYPASWDSPTVEVDFVPEPIAPSRVRELESECQTLGLELDAMAQKADGLAALLEIVKEDHKDAERRARRERMLRKESARDADLYRQIYARQWEANRRVRNHLLVCLSLAAVAAVMALGPVVSGSWLDVLSIQEAEQSNDRAYSNGFEDGSARAFGEGFSEGRANGWADCGFEPAPAALLSQEGGR